MLPKLKVYEIDYDFIIKNYLDRHLWKKIWTLFVFKEYVFTLNLYRIDTKNNKIEFEVKTQGDWYTEYITYDIENTSIKILKQQINGAIFRLIERLEESKIEDTLGYKEILDAIESERETLREIAKEFLDDNDVTNESIRDAYIDTYVDRNETAYQKREIYKDLMKYTVLTELYLIYCEVTRDTKRKQTILKANENNYAKIAVITSKIEDFIKELESEDYRDNMSYMLEGI